MNHRILVTVLVAGCLFAVAVCLADEPNAESLEELRSHRKYDEALKYLDVAEKNGATPPAFLEVLYYERGITFIMGSKAQKDQEVRYQWLVDGQKSLQKFVAEHKESALVYQAQTQLGNAGVERARILRKRVETTTGEAQEKLLADIRQIYADSQASFESALNWVKERLKTFPAALADPKKIDDRDRLRGDLLQAVLLVAATIEEVADTFPKGSLARTKAFSDAADRYEKIYKDYRTRMAGLYARMFQARCEQQLEHHKEAIKLFDELLTHPDAPDALHTLRFKVICLAVDSWLAEKRYQQVLDQVKPMLEAATDAEQTSSDFVALQVKLALAAKALAEEKKK